MRTKSTLLWTAAMVFCGVTSSAFLPHSAHGETALPPQVEPKVAGVLKACSDALAEAPAMSFRADVSRDVLLAYGQKVQLSSERDLKVMRPGSICGFNRGDLDRVNYWMHDGRLTLQDADTNAFAQIDVPNTIDAALDQLALEYGLVMPLADLLVADPYGSAMSNVESAGYAGLHSVRGIGCHHLVFRSPGLDWQLWVHAGEQPLPVRMVMTFTDVPHAPQWMADFHDWDLNPAIDEADFVFEAPEGAAEMDFDAFVARSEAVSNTPAEAAP